MKLLISPFKKRRFNADNTQWAICSFSLRLRFIDVTPDGKEGVSLVNGVSGQTRSQGLSSPHPKGASEERLLQAGHLPPKTGR